MVAKILTCLYWMLTCVRGQTYQDVCRLEQDLFRNYSRQVRPLFDQSRTLQINSSFVIISFLQIDEVEQVFSVNGALLLFWTDEILKWDPSDYGNMTYVFPDRMSIWLPRTMILNTAAKRDIFEDDHHPLVLRSTGFVSWAPGGIFPATCKFNLWKFPFDEQTCTVTIVGMHGVVESVQYVVPIQPAISFDLYKENSGWTLVSSSLLAVPATEDADEIDLTLTIKRRPSFFILNILLPVNLVAVLDILVFLIPIECGERIGVSLTVLLAQTVYMSITSTYLPSASDIVPLVVYFLSVLTLMAVLTVIMCILLAWLHHKEEEEQKNNNITSAFKSALKKLRGFGVNKTSPENTTSHQSDKTAEILGQRQRAEVFATQELQPSLFTLAQGQQQKVPFPYVPDQQGMDGHDTENTHAQGESARGKGHTPKLNRLPHSLSDRDGFNQVSSFAALEKGRYKLIATVLEQSCLLAFVSPYVITLLLFMILLVV